MGYSLTTCVFWKKKVLKKMPYGLVTVLSLAFFEKNLKIKIKNDAVLSMFKSLMGEIICSS